MEGTSGGHLCWKQNHIRSGCRALSSWVLNMSRKYQQSLFQALRAHIVKKNQNNGTPHKKIFLISNLNVLCSRFWTLSYHHASLNVLQSLLLWTFTSPWSTPCASWPTEPYTGFAPVLPCHSLTEMLQRAWVWMLCALPSPTGQIQQDNNFSQCRASLLRCSPCSPSAPGKTCCALPPASYSGCHSSCFKFSISFSCQVSCHFPPLPQQVFTASSYVIFETSWNINAQSWRTNKMVAFKKLTGEILLCGCYLSKSGSLPPLKPAESFKYLTTASDPTRCGTSFPWEICGIAIIMSTQFRHTLIFLTVLTTLYFPNNKNL